MRLYRPVGLEELSLIYQSDLREFPPRLPEQPIFYPVLNFPYANQIARDWNTASGSLAGYVTHFTVDDRYISQFEPHIVGSREHEELWVAAEQLTEFNQYITSPITVVSAHFSPNFRGYISQRGGMRGKEAVAQFMLLAASFNYSKLDFTMEIRTNSLAVFLHYPFWQQHDFSDEPIPILQSNGEWTAVTFEIRDKILTEIKDAWDYYLPAKPLPALAELV